MSVKTASTSGRRFTAVLCTKLVSVRGSRWLKPGSGKLR